MNKPIHFPAYTDNKQIEIPPYADVTTLRMGNVYQIKYVEHKNRCPHVRKTGKDTYMNVWTGEEFHSAKKASVKRIQSPASLRRTFQKIGQLITTNVAKPESVRWATFTYRENMTDTKQLYQDFRRFYGRLQTYCKNHEWSCPEYITICEPQARGAWHVHGFLIWMDQAAPYIPNEDLERLWRHGFTVIKALKDTDNIAGYLISYLSNIDANEEPKMNEKLSKSGKKKIIKHGRLSYYPAGFNIYRCSRGIKKPVVGHTKAFNALSLVDGAKPTYRCRKNIDVNGFKTSIQILEFKRRPDGSWGDSDNTEGWEYDLRTPAEKERDALIEKKLSNNATDHD